MLVVPPAENGRRSNATDTTVLAPKVYTPREAFFNKLRSSRKFDGPGPSPRDRGPSFGPGQR
jgi:hypothetical protein